MPLKTKGVTCRFMPDFSPGRELAARRLGETAQRTMTTSETLPKTHQARHGAMVAIRSDVMMFGKDLNTADTSRNMEVEQLEQSDRSVDYFKQEDKVQGNSTRC